MSNVPTAWFETVPSWQREQLNSLAEAGAAFLFLEGSHFVVAQGH